MSPAAVVLPPPLVKLTRHPIRWFLNKLILLGWALVLTYIGVLIVAGLYYVLSFRTSRALFLPPSFGVFGGSDRERFEVASEGM